jgi:3-(3-hydroxy-phenyl)propionate hydroxylase
MNMVESVESDVAIVGAGPVGLMLAALLGKRGVKTVVLERAFEVFPLPRAAHLDHTVLRVLQELGCAEAFLEMMTPNAALVLADQSLAPLVKIPATGIGRSGYPASMYFYQPDFDRALEKLASSFPSVSILRGHEVLTCDADTDSVRLHCQQVDSGGQVEVTSKWAVACDGASSEIRETWNEGLESLDFDERWLVLDLRIHGEAPELPDYALQVCDPRRAWVSNPVPGARYRVELRLREEDDPDQVMSIEYLRDFLKPLLRDVEFDVERDAIYTFHGLVAPSWRKGRVLLAGDAAHQMPPFLGQGMVSGIRDAHNLAWKLAGVLKGTYSESVIETYEFERKPHVRSVISSAIAVGRFVSQTDLVAAERRNRALRDGDMTNVPTFRIPDLAPGPLIGSGGGATLPQPAPALGAPTLDGRLGDGFCIISAVPVAEALRERWERTGVRVVETRGLGADREALALWMNRIGQSVILVRPDRYIMSAAESLEALDDSAEWAHILGFSWAAPPEAE